uniref:Transcriptional repressor p66 coiled-coil MBD2-interaction domain-containing protein n=2 Tax=Strongyloides stercoralis TaxID=6248 RepID=A0AAF5D4M9_STRER
MQVHSIVMENSSENHLPQTMNFSGIDNEKIKGKDDSVLSVDNSQDNADETHDPSLRRSTRVSALKAQEKIKLKDSVVSEVSLVEPIVSTENCQPVKKKPRIVHPELLDQYHCSFGVKLVDDEVCLMSDGSEISSLNGDEVDEMKQVMEDKQAHQSTESEKREQMIEIKHLKAALRQEEAKLLVMNKIRTLQQSNIKQDHKKNTTQYVSNGFKSSTTTPHSSRNSGNRFVNQNGTSLDQLKNPDSAGLHQLSQFFQRIFSSNILAPGIQNQAKEFLTLLAQSQKNNPQAAAALQQAALQMFNKIKATMPISSNNVNTNSKTVPQQQQQQPVNNIQQPPTTVPRTTSQPQSSILQQQNNEERRKQIRCQLRKHVEDNLRTVIKWPEILKNNFNFVPSAMTPDFTGLHGLNNVVQKNLKDKSVSIKIDVDLYECSICGTDWTPTWRAIGDSENEEDLKIACDKCAKETKLKAITEKYTEYLFKFLDQIAKQESELEAQIEAGKFDIQVQQQQPPPTQQQSQSSASSKQAPTTATNVSTKQSKSNTIINGITSNVSHQKQSVPSTSNIPKQQSQKAGSKRSAPISATASSLSSTTTNLFNNPTTAQYAQLLSAALANKNQVNNPQQNLAILALNQQLANNPATRGILQNLSANPVAVTAFVQAMANPNNQQTMFLKAILDAQVQSQKQQAELVKKMAEQALQQQQQQQQQQQNLRNQQAAKASQAAAAAKIATSLNNDSSQNAAAALQNNEMLKRILAMAQVDPSLALLIKSNPAMIHQYLAQQSLQNAGKK